METSSKVLLAAAVATALVPLWGYWYSIRHASLQLNVNDRALKTSTQFFGDPHHVTLAFRDASRAQLAVARSVEPLGYILAVHPDPSVGNCEQRKSDYADCYERYSAWSSTWASRVRTADVTIGACEMKAVPVTVFRSNSDWPVWWVPLRHIGGLPREYFVLTMWVDSRECVAVPVPQ